MVLLEKNPWSLGVTKPFPTVKENKHSKTRSVLFISVSATFLGIISGFLSIPIALVLLPVIQMPDRGPQAAVIRSGRRSHLTQTTKWQTRWVKRMTRKTWWKDTGDLARALARRCRPSPERMTAAAVGPRGGLSSRPISHQSVSQTQSVSRTHNIFHGQLPLALANHGDHWYIIWKSLGGIMVNGVPREVPRPEPKGPQAPRALAVGPPKAFHLP